MGTEGYLAKCYFEAYFQKYDWKGRYPRQKSDYINVTLDIGYTILFNFIESFVRLFGFDLYVGVYHRLWFKRKSLICDLIEPFRCIIDHKVRIALNRGQIKLSHFTKSKGEYRLKIENNSLYSKLFFDAIIPYKTKIFIYIQQYYRAFMQGKSADNYPTFQF